MPKPIHKLSARMQLMSMRLQNYKLALIRVKGTQLFFADALSRAHSRSTEPHNLFDNQFSVVSISTTSDTLSDIKQAYKHDDDIDKLKEYIQNSWPTNTHTVPNQLIPYIPHKDNLTIQNGLIMKGNRVLIPKALHTKMIDILHEPHLGITKTKQLARDTIFWPNIDTQIISKIEQCITCQKHRNQIYKEPLINHYIPQAPYHKIGADLFEIENKYYLATVDYYSKYPEQTMLIDLSSQTVIQALKQNFARHGIPHTIVSDNGLQLRSRECTEFANHYRFEPMYSSPQFPQSNGQIE